MAKQKIEDVFEAYAVVDQYGNIVTGEFDSSFLVFTDEAAAVDQCDTENGEQVVKIKGTYRFKVKV
jgi:hypothetical protein